MNIMDYFQFGQQAIKPVTDRMAQERAGRIAAAISASGQFNDPALSDPRVQDALGSMMLASKGNLGMEGTMLGNKLMNAKLLEFLKNPGGNSVRSGQGGMLYDSRPGGAGVIREPTPQKPQGFPYQVVPGGGKLNRENGQVTPLDLPKDPMKNYDSDDRSKIYMAGDVAVEKARRAAQQAGLEWTIERENEARSLGETEMKEKLLTDPSTKPKKGPQMKVDKDGNVTITGDLNDPALKSMYEEYKRKGGITGEEGPISGIGSTINGALKGIIQKVPQTPQLPPLPPMLPGDVMPNLGAIPDSSKVYANEQEARSSGRQPGEIIMVINPATGKPARARLK